MAYLVKDKIDTLSRLPGTFSLWIYKIKKYSNLVSQSNILRILYAFKAIEWIKIVDDFSM